jgi:hypothetical protein
MYAGLMETILEEKTGFQNPAWIENNETQFMLQRRTDEPQSSPRIESMSTGKLAASFADRKSGPRRSTR